MAFEVMEHTADAGIVARGATLAEAFAEVARGMYSLMVDLDAVRPAQRLELDLHEPDEERLLLKWLLELMFITETQGLVFSRFEVSLEPGHLRCVALGEPLDEQRHDPRAVVKGVTRHMLSIERLDDALFEVRVLFDL